MGAQAWVLAFGGLAASEPPAVSAPAPTTVVVWNAPASCPSQAEVGQAVARRVGSRPVEVRANVVEAQSGFVAALEVASETGTTQRSLQSPACATLVDAVVLLAVVATDPVPTLDSITPRLREADAIPAPMPVAQPPVAALPLIAQEPPPKPVAAVEARRRSRVRRIQPRVAAFAIFGAGTLPGIDAGIRGAFGIATRRVHADVTALYLGPRETVREDVRTSIDAWSVGVRVCPVVPLPTTRVELPICAVIGAGQLRASAEGPRVVGATPQQAAWVTAAAAPELAIVVHRLVRIVVGAEIGGTVVGPGFRLGTLGRVWKPRPWLARAQLGVEVRFR